MKKRIICLCVVISILFSGVIGRSAYVVFSNNYSVSSGYNSYVLDVETVYPDIRYRDRTKITNNKARYFAVLRPNERTLVDLQNILPASEVYQTANELGRGYPIIKEISPAKKDEAKYIRIITGNSSDYYFRQLISASSSGILKHIQPSKKTKMRFHIDALGRMLSGDEGELFEEKTGSLKSIDLTIDKDIEKITYDCCKNLSGGCAVVMDAENSSILALVSKPDSTYINKPFEQYSVGSVFKTVVALCALENNVELYYNCTGKTTLGDTDFSCQNNRKHGFVNLKTALADSCNCYFVNLALKLGKEKLLETAEKLGFGSEIALYNDWRIKSASLPTSEDLSVMGELALFGFGQGKLISTPLQICSALCTISNGGAKSSVQLLKSAEYDNGKTEDFKYPEKTQTFRKENCEKLMNYLRFVVSDGTGKNAESSDKKSAGKTATAQTGQFINGKEIKTTWFAGIYPFDKPKYAIVVMCERGKSGSEDCAPVFAHIVEKLKNL